MELRPTICSLLIVFISGALVKTQEDAKVSIKQDSDGVPLGHLMAKQTFSKRTRQALLEINAQELQTMVETEPYVAILFQDDSKVQNVINSK